MRRTSLTGQYGACDPFLRLSNRALMCSSRLPGGALAASFLSVRPHAYAIRAARRDRNLSLEQVTSLTGIDKGHLSRVENGKAGLSDDNIHKLAEVYGVPHTAITHDIPQERP